LLAEAEERYGASACRQWARRHCDVPARDVDQLIAAYRWANTAPPAQLEQLTDVPTLMSLAEAA
jgi:hypothetical protein